MKTTCIFRSPNLYYIIIIATIGHDYQKHTCMCLVTKNSMCTLTWCIASQNGCEINYQKLIHHFARNTCLSLLFDHLVLVDVDRKPRAKAGAFDKCNYKEVLRSDHAKRPKLRENKPYLLDKLLKYSISAGLARVV